MRILFSSGPLYGHVNTLLPLALAAQRAGHDVVFATGADMAPHVVRRGLQVWPVGFTQAQAGGHRPDSWLSHFADAAARRADDLVPRAQAWRPDLLIHEETELAGPVAAAASGARLVVHGLGLMPPARIWPPFVAAIERLVQQCGVPDIAAALKRATYLHICPPALQPTGERIWQRVLPLRPTPGTPVAGEQLPPGLAALPYPRTVHLTLGTVYNEAIDVLGNAIAGLRTLPLNLVVTVGPAADPARFGPQPAHVLIERYVAHAQLLPRCDLVVSHGGAGVMFGALANGLPQLIIAQGADQFMNAQACAQSGAALSLASAEAHADAVAACAQRLLIEPAFGAAARTVRAQIDAMPDADATLAALTGS